MIRPDKDRILASDVRAKLLTVPAKPGVYLMKDAAGTVIYVGKARNLKKRMAAYAKPADPMDMKTRVLVSRIAAFETILTASEKEALILESNLIKKNRPRYNVVLKDDKRYPALRLDLREAYPHLTVVRKIQKDGALYFGPFASSGAVRETLRFIDKTFKLRKCKDREFRTRTRPCLHYQMQRCLAPCCLDVVPGRYAEIAKEVVLFLKGRTPDLIRKIRKEMTTASGNRQFEKAAALRDKMFALQKILEKQIVVTTDFIDRDIIGLAGAPDFALVTLLPVRGGFMTGARDFEFPGTSSTDAELVRAFIRQYYEAGPFVPKEIIVPCLFDDAPLLEDWLGELKGKRVRIRYPKRGEKAALLKMAAQNAASSLGHRLDRIAQDRQLLERLQKRCHLVRSPVRIECFDNSNLGGVEPVSSMVVFENGRPKKSAYRRFRLATDGSPDDYNAMAEVIGRRFAGTEATAPRPDLIMVDGGKGHLNVALAVIEEFGLAQRVDVLGIAKKDDRRGEAADKIYLPGRANPVRFGKDADLLLFLQRIRDEAHRFAITFHRRRRTRSAMESALDTVPGIGPVRKKMLLMHFGGVEKIRAATVDELGALPGMNRRVAESLKTALS
jgi:excinuclease ABC subunit C